MSPERLREITARYAQLRIAVVGDFCLDRYFEIDPSRAEVSIETGLPVHNVVNVRAQPGAAGTILTNLAALGVGRLFPVGFCGEDGEGYELLRALRSLPGVDLTHFLQTPQRRTFTYGKPLMLEAGQPPRELNRLDAKNWTPTPPEVTAQFIRSIAVLGPEVDAIILMDQVDIAETGVVTTPLLRFLRDHPPGVPVVADSRRGLRDFPPMIFKMNAAELAAFRGRSGSSALPEIERAAVELAQQNGRAVFVTLAEDGLIGALADGTVEHVPAWPVRGAIDVVGAGDCVTANLTAALAVGATLHEGLALAALASSIVIHQVGTSGAASVAQMVLLLE